MDNHDKNNETDLTGFCVQLADTLDQREVEYGNASEHFADVAKLWGVILKRDIAPHQVALCLDALKTARLINNPLHADSWLDKAGYAALGHIVALAEQSPSKAIKGCDVPAGTTP